MDSWTDEEWRFELKRAEAQRGVMLGPDGQEVMDETSNPEMTLGQAKDAAYDATRALKTTTKG